MRFLKAMALALAIGFLSPLGVLKSEATATEKKIVALDTDPYTNLIKKVRIFTSRENNLSKEDNELLIKLTDKLESIIGKLRKIQDRYRSNIAIRDQIRLNLRNRNTYFAVDVETLISNDAISKLFLDVVKEDDYFYYSQYGTAKITTSIDPKKSKDGKAYVEKANFDISYRSDLATEYDVRDFIRQWTDENIGENDSDYYKVKKIHDFIVKKSTYNTGDIYNMSGDYSIYHPSAILFGEGGVCNAYASLFELMAKEVGIESTLLTGRGLKNGEDHMWNMVKVNENYYHIDTTWDDPVIDFSLGEVENLEDFVIYDYFLKSDEEIKKSRTIDQDKKRPRAEESYYFSPENSKIEEVGGTYWVV